MWYLYVRSSQIDFFSFCTTLRELMKSKGSLCDEDAIDKAQIMELAIAASGAAGKSHGGWDGGLRLNEVYAFAVPPVNESSCCMDYGLVWKAESNGTTFICSPIESPHFGDELLATIKLTSWAFEVQLATKSGF